MTANVFLPQAGHRRSTAIKKETTPGTPASGAWKTLRNTGGAGVVGDFSTTESAELTGIQSLGLRDLIRTGEKGQADYNFEFSYDGADTTFDVILESALQAEWGDSVANRLIPGTKEITCSIEDVFNDISKVQSIQGAVCTSFNLQMTAGELVTGSASFVSSVFNVGTPTTLTVAATITNQNEVEISSGTASGATTDSAGYAIGASAVTLASAGTGDFNVGDNITFAGDAQTYIITAGDADVSDGGTISFTPALKVAIAASPTAITRSDQTVPASAIVGSTLKIRNATTTANHGYYSVTAVSGDKLTVDGTLTNVTDETMTLEYSSSSIQPESTTDALGYKPFIAGNSVAFEISTDGGSTWLDSLEYGFRVPSAGFTITNEVAELREITNTEAYAVHPTKRTIDINVEYHLIDTYPIRLLNDDTSIAIRFQMIDSEGTTAATGNKYIFAFPDCKTVSATAGDASAGSEMTGSWALKATLNGTAANSLDMQIDRVAST